MFSLSFECITTSSKSHKLSGFTPGFHTEDEALAIENAIRTAINTVDTVMSGTCSRRVSE